MAFANKHFNSSVKIEHQFVKMGNERSLCIKETQLPHRQHIRQPAASFRDLVRNSNVYVDKSLLVSWILEHESVLSLTYPPQWGKSIALSMLYEFFALHVDSEGKAMEPNNDSWAYRYFKLGQIMHDNGNVEKLKKTPSVANSESFADIVDRRRKKEINKQKFTRENETGESDVSQSVANGNSIIDQHLGKYPIIHIDLSNLQPAVNNLYRFFEAFCELIGELYERHDYMIDILKEIVSHNEPIRGTSVTQVKAMLKKYETYLYRKESSHDEMYSSLEFLSRILNWHFQTKVFIFIDNYDYWAKGVYVAAGSQQAPHIYNFISSFMTRTLKNNQYIRNAVLTGTLGFKICFPQPALSGVVDYSLLEKNTCFAFGFTEEEVVQLLDITGRSITLAKEWYGGYNIISEDYEPKAVLYNPWSIVNFVNKGRIDTYWCDMKSINILAEIMRYGKISQLFRILTCYNDYVEVDRETLSLNSFNSVEMFSNIVTLLFSDNISSNFQITTDTYNAIISVLYAYGYLSLTEDSPLSSSSTKYQLQLPNEEIKNEILNVHQSTYFYCTYVPDMKKIQKIYTSLVKFVKCEGKNLRLKRDLENELNEFRSWMNSIWGNGKTKYWNKSAPHNAPFLISLLVMMNHDNQAQWTMFQQNKSDPEHQYFVFFYKNEYCIVFEQRYFYEDQTRLHISWEDNMKVRAKQELLGKCDFVLPMNRLQICRISG